MKKQLFILPILALFVITIMGAVSAELPEVCATVNTTYVTGIVYNSDGNTPLSGANVSVTCNVVNIETTKSADDGSYTVDYDASECAYKDDVTVSVVKGDLTGQNPNPTWYTNTSTIGCLEVVVNVACGDVSMVPEFGFFVGALTILSAVGIFFFVRR